MIEIGKNREFFWDEMLIDTEMTTAEKVMGQFTKRERVMVHDKPWEGDGCNFHSILPVDGKYRMYYNAWRMIDKNPETGEMEHSTTDVKIAVLESADGICWERPKLGLIEFEGSKDNNLLLTKESLGWEKNLDNFYAFIDENPNRVIPERFKAVMAHYVPLENGKHKNLLDLFVSDDGYRWKFHHVLTEKGAFDSLNTIHWNRSLNKYLCFFRDFHSPDPNLSDEEAKKVMDMNDLVRDLRVIESEDCISWSEPKRLDYMGAEDVPLYTNGITVYPRATQMLVGFPVRYVERKAWTETYDRLCGREMRQMRTKLHPRYGLAITDGLFMCSRDGKQWFRTDEAFLRPGAENGRNWVYGDAYLAVGLIETPSETEGAESELSVYIPENHWLGIPAELFRWTIRKDGFFSRHAGSREKLLVTKPFCFDGEKMLLNLSTSARGYVYVIIKDASSGKELHSCELFGDSCDRVVDFDGEVKAFAGKEVVMEMRMREADVYAFKFE